MMNRYNPGRLEDGFNTLADGEEIFYVSNPGLGLWAIVNGSDRQWSGSADSIAIEIFSVGAEPDHMLIVLTRRLRRIAERKHERQSGYRDDRVWQ